MRHSLRNPRDSSRYQTQCPEPFHCISNFQISDINKTSAANEYIWGLQSWNLSNFRAKANQHKSVPIKPQDKLLVCNGQQVFLVILDELLKYCIIDRQNTIKLLYCPWPGSDEMEHPDADEVHGEDDSDGTHQCGFLEHGMSRAFEACGKVTASAGFPSPPFLSHLPL